MFVQRDDRSEGQDEIDVWENLLANATPHLHRLMSEGEGNMKFISLRIAIPADGGWLTVLTVEDTTPIQSSRSGKTIETGGRYLVFAGGSTPFRSLAKLEWLLQESRAVLVKDRSSGSVSKNAVERSSFRK